MLFTVTPVGYATVMLVFAVEAKLPVTVMTLKDGPVPVCIDPLTVSVVDGVLVPMPTKPVAFCTVMCAGLTRSVLWDAGMPIADVMTRAPVPLLATAANRDSSGDQHTLRHEMLPPAVRNVQAVPLELVMT
jgi:hypothetical protein